MKQNEAQCARAESAQKGVNWRSKYVTQAQHQRPESPTATLTWHACKCKVHTLHQRYILSSGGDYVPCNIRMPGESYRRCLRSLLLLLYDVFRTLINSLVCWLIIISLLTICVNSFPLPILADSFTRINVSLWEGVFNGKFLNSSKEYALYIYLLKRKEKKRHLSFHFS